MSVAGGDADMLAARRNAFAATSVDSLGELLDHLLVEGWEVVGLAARDDSLVDDDLLVDPVAARVADVGLERRPRRDAPAADGARLDEHPRAVADDGDRLARVHEVAH